MRAECRFSVMVRAVMDEPGGQPRAAEKAAPGWSPGSWWAGQPPPPSPKERAPLIRNNLPRAGKNHWGKPESSKRGKGGRHAEKGGENGDGKCIKIRVG